MKEERYPMDAKRGHAGRQSGYKQGSDGPNLLVPCGGTERERPDQNHKHREDK